MMCAVVMCGMVVQCDAAGTFLGYYVPINYSSNSKTDTTVLGGYAYFGDQSHGLELEFDSVSGMLTQQLTQQDVIGIYTYKGLPYSQLRIGFHHINGVEAQTQGNTYIFGGKFDQVDYYGRMYCTLGTDIYTSFYSDHRTVVQLSPYITAYFQPVWPYGYYDVTTRLNIIANSNGTTEYLKGIETVANYNLYPWSLGVQVWVGESKFGAFSGGNIVYNTADTLKEGVAISAAYSFSPALSVRLAYQLQSLQAVGDTTASDVSKIQYMVGYNF
jgi:hypothetical protein